MSTGSLGYAHSGSRGKLVARDRKPEGHAELKQRVGVGSGRQHATFDVSHDRAGRVCTVERAQVIQAKRDGESDCLSRFEPDFAKSE